MGSPETSKNVIIKILAVIVVLDVNILKKSLVSILALAPFESL